jgi:hypothetical protein
MGTPLNSAPKNPKKKAGRPPKQPARKLVEKSKKKNVKTEASTQQPLEPASEIASPIPNECHEEGRHEPSSFQDLPNPNPIPVVKSGPEVSSFLGVEHNIALAPECKKSKSRDLQVHLENIKADPDAPRPKRGKKH